MSIPYTLEETRPNPDLVDQLDLFHHAFWKPRLRKTVIVVKPRYILSISLDEDIQEGDLEHHEPKGCLGLFEDLLKPIVVCIILHDLQLRRVLKRPAHVAHDGFLEEWAVELCPTDWVGEDRWERNDKRNKHDQYTEVRNSRFDAGSRRLDEELQTCRGFTENKRSRAAKTQKEMEEVAVGDNRLFRSMKE